MGIMIDKRPQFEGEGFTWDCFAKNLPNDVVVYTHREVLSGDECDFALLIKNRGILIVEVKGWKAKHIYEVLNDGHVVLTNHSSEKGKTQGSPREQARKYRFQWLNYIQDKLGFSPLVLHMVCYPFLSEREYHEKRLDIISEKQITLFGEDLRNPIKLGQKIDNWFHRKRGISSVDFDDTKMSLVRQVLEPSFQENRKEEKEMIGCYSLLKVYGKEPRLGQDIEKLTDAYFEGTKFFLFVREEREIEWLAEKLREGFQKRNIVVEHGTIRLAKREEQQESFYKKGKGGFCLFNFEAYVVGEDFTDNENISIVDGQMNPLQDGILRRLEGITNFNYGQFMIEHADIGGNVLVRAGAGTGKTYSMVSRIAFLCNSRRGIVYNLVDDIAMVTFTNEAADNMKVRLKQAFMNYYLLTRNKRFLHDIDSVDLMQISTIHKFAKRMIQNLSLEFGVGHDFSITSSSYEKEQIYEKYLNGYLVEKEKNDPYITNKLRMPVHKFRKLLVNFAKQLYDKSCDIKTVVREEMGDFNEIPFFNDIISEVIIPAEKEYYDSVLSKNKIDLKECMILLHNVLKEMDADRWNINYKYLFIDEFQDTDDVQIESFLKLQERMAGLKLFIVGDIKQSIYRFRGATDSAFERVRKGKDHWKEFSLTRNYRTDAKLLEKLDNIFMKAGEKGYLKFIKGQDSLKSNIISGLASHGLVRKAEYSGKNNGQFMEVLFGEIQRQKDMILGLETRRELNIKERTIAVLVRENWQIEELLLESRKRGCYLETEIGGELYQLTSTMDLYKLVMALMNPRDPVFLFNLIKSNYVNLQIDIQGLHGIERNKKSEVLTEILNQYFKENVGKGWEELINETHRKPVLAVLRDIYENTQPWQNYDKEEAGQRFYKANYDLVLEKMIKAYSVDYLSLNVIENSLHINILTGQEELARNIDGEAENIRLLCTTVHKSKGLEYGTVILPYCDWDMGATNKSSLDVNYSDHKLSYGMKIEKSKKVDKVYNSNYNEREERIQRIQEESRVLYVALTRAIRNIVWMKNTDVHKKDSWQEFMEG